MADRGTVRVPVPASAVPAVPTIYTYRPTLVLNLSGVRGVRLGPW